MHSSLGAHHRLFAFGCMWPLTIILLTGMLDSGKHVERLEHSASSQRMTNSKVMASLLPGAGGLVVPCLERADLPAGEPLAQEAEVEM